MFNIELDKQTIAEMKEKAIEEATQRMVKNLTAGMLTNNRQLVSEIKNLVVKALVKELSDDVAKRFNESDIESRLLTSVENRINGTIHNKLRDGITVKFAQDEM